MPIGTLLVESLLNLLSLRNYTSPKINPLSPNSDQHQISPCNINAYSTPEVMRIMDMNTQGEFS